MVSKVLAGIALVLALVSLAYKPFLFIPMAVILILTASRISDDRRTNGLISFTISVCFVVGAAIAVIYRRALY
jgi:hypothetical protein